jgi:N-acetyl-anhydromuramyl-L-alanine amidase AmpD
MKRTVLVILAALLAGCAGGPPRIDTSFVSQNQDSRAQFLIIHFTAESFPSSLKTLTQGSGTVSSHYLVRDDPPTIFRLVDENRRAWHAGVSSWKGQTALNAASIGIEIVNLGDTDLQGNPWPEFPKAQMDLVVELVKDIVKRHGIRPDRVLGHSDIAPQRKVDPGPRFPWKRLADEGLIAWPDASEVARRQANFEATLPDILWFQDRLAKHGFAVPHTGELDTETRRVVMVFQMKYRPERFDGIPDAETAAILDVLVSPTAPPPMTIDRELSAIATDPQRPLASLSVLAIRGGAVVYEKTFGRRFIDTSGRGADKPADTSTLYRIASISKLVTALGVMALVEEGKLALDADVGGYLGYRVRNPHFPDAPVTLRMLMTHTSSLRDDGGYSWRAGVELKDVLTPGGARYGEGAMWSAQSKPGAYFTYCNLGWGVIGTIVEKASGERFDRFMKRRVLDPLGLQGGYDAASLPAASLANLATLYRKRPAGESNDWNPNGPWIAQVDDYSAAAPVARRADYVIGSNATIFSPTGGLRASASDLGRVMRMLMNGGELDGKRVLQSASVTTMLSEQWRFEGVNGQIEYGSHRGRFNAWGLGNQHFLDVSGPDYGDRLVEGGGFKAVGHLGDAYGLLGTFAFDPATKNGFVFLVGGTGFDPETDRGAYSAGARFEERIATALYRLIK